MTASEKEVADLASSGVYVAGVLDPGLVSRTDLYDVLVSAWKLYMIDKEIVFGREEGRYCIYTGPRDGAKVIVSLVRRRCVGGRWT